MDTKVFSFPENGNNNGWGDSLGGGVLGFILGLLLGNNGNGIFGGSNSNNNTDLIMQAVSGTDADIRALSSTLNTDLAQTTEAIHQIQNAVSQVSASTGMGFLQVINAFQSGNAAISRQLCECCCENRLLTTQQGYESRIAMADQTNQLKSQADNNARSITDAITAQSAMITQEFCNLKERELQGKIDSLTAENAILRTTMNNDAQTARFAQMLAPISAEIASIKAAQPPTVTLPLNQYTAVPTLLANAGSDFIASYWANRLTQATTDTTTTTPAVNA